MQQKTLHGKSKHGYKIASLCTTYADMMQRWVLVFSEQAYRRVAKTVRKRLVKAEEALNKALRQLGSELFACEKDAQKAFCQQQHSYPLFLLTATIAPLEKYAHAGRPKAGEAKQCLGYPIPVPVTRNGAAIGRASR